MSEPRDFKTQEVPCPACAERLSSILSPHGHLPKTGDMTICFGCSTVLVLDKMMPLSLRVANDDELKAWGQNPSAKMIETFMKEVRLAGEA